jgi:hypothetical protein
MDGRTELERLQDRLSDAVRELHEIADHGDKVLTDENRDRQVLAESLIHHIREVAKRAST